MSQIEAAEKIKKNNRGLWIPVILSLLVVNFLFFIDEGFYDLRWMKDSGNWIVFFIYTTFIFVSQVLTKHTLFYKAKTYSVLCCLIGLMIGIGSAVLFFSGS